MPNACNISEEGKTMYFESSIGSCNRNKLAPSHEGVLKNHFMEADVLRMTGSGRVVVGSGQGEVYNP
jgi:hypothetical protein